MNNNRPSVVWRLWLLIAQVIAISVGLLIACKAFGPEPVATVRTTAAKASASAVNIYSRKALPRQLPRWLRPYGSDEEAVQGHASLGFGIIVAAQGFILTNNHVVKRADEIAVMLPGGKVAKARVVGTDPETDLALPRVGAKGLQPIAPAGTTSVQTGDSVFAVDDPFGVGQTVAQGIVSATRRNRFGINIFENFIQTDAAINPGNSGGALVDTAGHLLGICAAIYSRSGRSQGIGFAIPVSLARQVMEQIVATSRGWLGVSARDVIHEIAALSLGTKAQFKVLRGREAVSLAVELGQRPVARKQ